MRLHRRWIAVVAAGVSLLGVAGCQQPVPDIGVYSSGRYVGEPAATYCFTVEDAAADRCRVDDPTPLPVPVRDGNPVGISVPKEIADSLWVVVLSEPGRPERAQRSPYQIEKSYLSFTPTFNTSPRLLADIVAYRSEGGAVRPVGLWRLELVRRAPLNTAG
jgi:hypothetical protein